MGNISRSRRADSTKDESKEEWIARGAPVIREWFYWANGLIRDERPLIGPCTTAEEVVKKAKELNLPIERGCPCLCGIHDSADYY